MSKWHVTDDGRVLSCSAQIQSCTYSKREDNRHFTSEEDAQEKASALLQSRYNTFSTQRKKTELPKRIKNDDRPGSLSIDVGVENDLLEDRFGKMKPIDLPEEHFSDFLKECELSAVKA